MKKKSLFKKYIKLMNINLSLGTNVYDSVTNF